MTDVDVKRRIIDLLEEKDEARLRILMLRADAVRRRFLGDAIHLRGLIEFSNHCRRDCLYCGLRRSNKNLVRYRMAPREIFAQATEAAKLGFRTVVLQSGEDPAYTIRALCSLVRGIKSGLSLAVTLCVGERTREDFLRLKKAGVDRYLLRFETSDPRLFRILKPDADYERRFRCLEWLKAIGFQVGSGNIVGLPGQTMESLAEDILKFREMRLDMVGIGPFIAHPDTPLQGSRNGSLDLVLRVVALTRIMTRTTHMPATTATGTIDREGRQKALQCGANVLMPNLTPVRYRRHYMIYPDKVGVGEVPAMCRSRAESMAHSLGRTVGLDEGHSLGTAFRRS